MREYAGHWYKKLALPLYIAVSEEEERAKNEIYAHRARAVSALGKLLPSKACIFFLDRFNLRDIVLCENAGYAALLRARRRVLRHGGHPDEDKLCATCHFLLPQLAFGANRCTWDGLAPECRSCCKARHRRTRQKHKSTTR